MSSRVSTPAGTFKKKIHCQLARSTPGRGRLTFSSTHAP
jgi:hypothetical protein